MSLIKTKGLVIKEVPFNDLDKILVLLTSELGRISVSARNSRKGRSLSSYGTQILTYGEYVLYKGRNGYFFNSCDVLANFYDLASDIICFTHAAHMLEMAEDAGQDPASSAQVLNVLLHGLHALRKGRNPLLVSSAFALKLMQITGYPPHISSCVSCNAKDMEMIYFGFKKCGFMCEKCAQKENDSFQINNGVAKAIFYVLCSEDGGVFNFELSEKVLESFSNLCFRYMEERLDKHYRKLDFLKEFKMP